VCYIVYWNLYVKGPGDMHVVYRNSYAVCCVLRGCLLFIGIKYGEGDSRVSEEEERHLRSTEGRDQGGIDGVAEMYRYLTRGSPNTAYEKLLLLLLLHPPPWRRETAQAR